MAEIDIQEKQGQPMWVWVLGILALLVLVGVIWAVMRNGDDRDEARMYQDTVPPARDTLISGLDRADDAVAEYVVFSRQPVQAAGGDPYI
jgi:hypothetical protein